MCVCVCVCVCVSVCVCVCVFTPKALITSHMKGTHNNWIRQFYSFSIFLIIAINKLNEHDLSNTVSGVK